MTAGEGAFLTSRIEEADIRSGFRCGVHALDDYFTRHALPNDVRGVGRAYVYRSVAPAGETPQILGYYTLSMSLIEADHVSRIAGVRLPRYPMPVALVGRLAVDERARGRRVGEALLLDAFRRVVAAQQLVACTGVMVDAKDNSAADFYLKYDFTPVTDQGWPRRLFIPIGTVVTAFEVT